MTLSALRRKISVWPGIQPPGALFLALAAPLFLLFAGTAAFFFHYARLTDRQVRGGAFQNATDVFAAPLRVSEGDLFTPTDLAAALQQGGYELATGGEPRTFRFTAGTLEVFPSGGSRPALISFTNSKRIATITVNGNRASVWSAGSPVIATLTANRDDADRGRADREKRKIVAFADIPRVLIDAVTSAEDKRFFEHHGVDLPRMLKASWIDFREGRKTQGGSTLTMQLVRGLWLEPEKKWTRKAAEVMMTAHLERKWTKEQIFEAYANQIYLGRQAAYGIHGFAEGSRMFFSKSLRDLTLPEAALLAGIVQRPSYFNPYRHPDRAKDRRDLVLALMRDNGRIAAAQYEDAVAAPIKLSGPPERDDSFGAPYFLDLVTDELQRQGLEDFDEPERAARKVYTTLDLNLQRAASEAVAAGMKEVDALLARQTPNGKAAGAEVALIALDPHTGEIKALLGGRNYAQSQLNRVLANRPPGSIFKPFVYAAALNTGVEGGQTIYTPASVVDDSPATFWFAGKAYQPGNYHQESYGPLTLRQALAKSDNIAAVKLAQQIGYARVVALAKRAGLNDGIKATPSVALGSYVVTPLEMAGAWTMFANGGTLVKPHMVKDAKNFDGETLRRQSGEQHQALDPRVAFVTLGMLQEVMRSGTAAGVRSRGFVVPAAGKTGTSHDGWFAGFTSQLLCLVWVGFDNYRELNLEGAKSALPIWTEFMKKASRFAPYRNTVDFPQPSGIASVAICTETGKLASELCPEVRREMFIDGTQPQSPCDYHDFAPGELIGQSQ